MRCDTPSQNEDSWALWRKIGVEKIARSLQLWRLYLPSKLQNPFTSSPASWRRRTLLSTTAWELQDSLAVLIGDWWNKFSTVLIAELRCGVMLAVLVLRVGAGDLILVICFWSLQFWIFCCKFQEYISCSVSVGGKFFTLVIFFLCLHGWILYCKGKGKVFPVTGHEGPEGE